MSAGAISSAAPTTATSTDAFSSLSSGDFLKVMLSELQNQDPFQPQDSGQLVQEMSDLRNIESQLSMQSTMQSMVLQGQLSSAGGMINKYVTGTDASSNAVAGTVTGITVANNIVSLNLDSGQSLPMSNVTGVANGPPTGTPGATTPASTANTSAGGLNLASLLSSLLPGSSTTPAAASTTTNPVVITPTPAASGS